MTEPFRKNFPATELRCKCPLCNGQLPNYCEDWALDKLQAIRDEFGEAMHISSAFRCSAHPSESRKRTPGTHNKGIAFDVTVPWGAARARLLAIALKHGVKGVGIANGFVHLDFRPDYMSWTY